MAFFRLCFAMCIFFVSLSAIADDVLTCPVGYYISDDTCVQVPTGAVSPGGTSTGYTFCSWTTYSNEDNSKCISCPPEYPYSGYANTSIFSCFRICIGGTYMGRTTDIECTLVETDSWAPIHLYYYGHDANTDNTLHLCPIGTRTRGTRGYGADKATDCARILHVGNNVMRLIGEKKTTPALAISAGGTTYWAQMSSVPTHMNNRTDGVLRISVGDTEYWVHDDTIVTHVPYPWESADYDWGEIGKFTYDQDANTWSVKFTDSTWSGLSHCNGEICECKMLSPAVSEWVWRGKYPNCLQKCALECGWAYASGPGYKSLIISAVLE